VEPIIGIRVALSTEFSYGYIGLRRKSGKATIITEALRLTTPRSGVTIRGVSDCGLQDISEGMWFYEGLAVCTSMMSTREPGWLRRRSANMNRTDLYLVSKALPWLPWEYEMHGVSDQQEPG